MGDVEATVTVMVPLLDDAAGIGPCLDAVLAQQARSARIVEVLVADGGSTDGSRDVVAGFAARDSRVRLLENPDRFVPGGLNRAIAASRGEVLVRVDSHTVIEANYVESAVEVLRATGADVVGGGMRPTGDTPFGAAVAWALSSRWGIGGSRFHLEGAEGWTDAVYMGVFPRSTFDRFGGYHPRFNRNQDDELTYRIREAGGRVWLSPRLRSSYTPRGDRRRLWRQFLGYGRFKPLVLVAHPSGARVRHLVPSAALASWVALPVALVTRRPVLAVPAVLHAGAVLGVAAVAAGRGGRLHQRAVALATMHLAYGAGFVAGLLGLLRGERPGPPPGASATAAPGPGGAAGSASGTGDEPGAAPGPPTTG